MPFAKGVVHKGPRLRKTTRRSNNAFLMEVYGQRGNSGESPEINMSRRIIRAYGAWLYKQLWEGKRVNLFDFAQIKAVMRAERNFVGEYRAHQPAAYRLIIVPTENLKARMRVLAADKSRFFFDFNPGSKNKNGALMMAKGKVPISRFEPRGLQPPTNVTL